MRMLGWLVTPLPALFCLFMLDSWLAPIGDPLHTRTAAEGALLRMAEQPDARVVVLGSSTTADWLTPAYLGDLFGYPQGLVLDAHINGCLQDCTWAAVRRLKSEGRHFDLTLFGVNHGSECELADIRRVALQSALLPLRDYGLLLGQTFESEKPLQALIWTATVPFSRAYSDPPYARARIRRAIGARRSSSDFDTWIRSPEPTSPRNIPPCDYSERSTHLMQIVSLDLLRDLSDISKHVIVLLLPDRRLALHEPDYLEEWERHRRFQQHLVSQFPEIRLLDLTQGGLGWDSFLDRVHVGPRGRNQLRRAFESALRGLGSDELPSAARKSPVVERTTSALE